ncbi:MAG: beta-N-acetylhexosaminidase [Kiritimatiellae bacterium]|nr:beta-N-acetylhexosaminidase [Kiritimatiellia bacterium]
MMKETIAGFVAVVALSASAGALVPAPRKLVKGEGALAVRADICATARFATDASIPREGYRLSVTKDGVTVASSDDAGRFYALRTLMQLADGEREIQAVEIEDSPRYPWRGVHLDECRHFFGKETVKQVLDLMAYYKLNRFHWHLTEDQGWRIDVPGYPELVKYGAVRPSSVVHGKRAARGTKEDADKLNGVKYGPYYYTEADLREIVAYAAERHIQIIPEIELPGHVYAALAAYPQYACRPENLAERTPRLVWGIEKDVLCVGNDEAIRFMENVVDWVCKVFPGDVVHIGGDECPQVRWQTCPKCQKRIADEGLGDHNGLQPWITRHFVKFLADRGKRALGWDEYLLGDIPKSAIGMSWREGRSGAGHEHVSAAAAAMRGHDVVLTPCSYCYLDYGQGLKEDPFFYIGGKVTLARCYSFDPCAGVADEVKAHILGGQGNNWTEYTWNEYDLAWKMWPRMLALSEVFWLGEAKPGFDDFKSRAAAQRQWLIRNGVNCAPLE